MGEPLIAQLFVASAIPVIKILLICGIGAFSARKGLLTREGRRVLGALSFLVFNPALIFVKLSSTLTPARLVHWWPLVLNTGISTAVGLGLGYLGVRLLGMRPGHELRPHTIVSIALGNLGNLPLVIVSTLAASSAEVLHGIPPDRAEDLAVSYVMVGLLIPVIAHATIGFSMLRKHEPLPQPADAVSGPSFSGHSDDALVAAAAPRVPLQQRHKQELLPLIAANASATDPRVAGRGGFGEAQPPVSATAPLGDGCARVVPRHSGSGRPTAVAAGVFHAAGGGRREAAYEDGEADRAPLLGSGAAEGTPGTSSGGSMDEEDAAATLRADASGAPTWRAAPAAATTATAALRDVPAAGPLCGDEGLRTAGQGPGEWQLRSQAAAGQARAHLSLELASREAADGSSACCKAAASASAAPPAGAPARLGCGTASPALLSRLPSRRVASVARQLWKEATSPPLLAILLSVPVGCIAPLKRAFFGGGGGGPPGDGAPLALVTDCLAMLGDCTIPAILLILGATLANGPGAARVPLRITSLVSATRLALLPLLGLGLVMGAYAARLFEAPDPIYLLVLLIHNTAPTAIMVHTMASVQQNRSEEVSTILFWGYMAGILVIPLWLTLFLYVVKQSYRDTQ